MKNLIKKILKENYKFPHYSKGEILIFPHQRHKGMDISSMAKELGYEVDKDFDYDGEYFLIKTPIGGEMEVGQDFVNNYPEFISSYERRDVRNEELYDKLDRISEMVSNLQDNIGSKFIDDNWNRYIDTITEELNELKF